MSCFIQYRSKRYPISGYKIAQTMCLAFAVLLYAAPSGYAQYAAFDDPQSSSNNTTGPDLKPSVPSSDGGNIAVGDTAQVISLFKNVSNMPITVKAVNLYPSANVSASVGTDNCSKSAVPPGAECAITTSIAGISSGAFRVELLIDHDGRSRLTTAAVTGTVGGTAAGQQQQGSVAPELIPAPDVVDFEKLETRTPLVRSVLLNNATTTAIEVSAVELVADPKTGFSVSSQDCKKLEAGKSCLATVMWTPYSVGKAEGVILVRHTGPKGITIIPVKGEYSPKKTAEADIFPESVPGKGLVISDRKDIDFGDEVDGAASITVSLVNTGDVPVELTSVKLSGSDNGLTLSGDGCVNKLNLEPQEACPLTVNWAPRREGPIIDDIQIRHNGVRGVLVLPVRGEAETPVIADQSLVTVQNMFEGGMGIPKLPGADIQSEKLDTSATSGSEAQAAVKNAAVGMEGSNIPSLDGYKVTSHSATKAVITGPFGRMIVNDGEIQIIAGKSWIVHIVPQGVELIGDRKVVNLIFDRSFTAKIEKETAQMVDGATSEAATGSSSSSGSSSKSSSKNSSKSSSSSSKKSGK